MVTNTPREKAIDKCNGEGYTNSSRSINGGHMTGCKVTSYTECDTRMLFLVSLNLPRQM